jgi:hypothetical protein
MLSSRLKLEHRTGDSERGVGNERRNAILSAAPRSKTNRTPATILTGLMTKERVRGLPF